MKINPRHYPTIILVTFVIFLLLGFLLGFLPAHGGEGNGHGLSLLIGFRMTTKKSSLSKSRRTIQWIGVVGTFVLGLRHIMPGETWRGGFRLIRFVPSGVSKHFCHILLPGICSRLPTCSTSRFCSVFMGVALVAGRAFCGWMCPLGTLQDFLASWGRRLTGERKHIRGKASKALLPPFHLPAIADKFLRYAKYLKYGFELLRRQPLCRLPHLSTSSVPVRARIQFQDDRASVERASCLCCYLLPR